MHTMQTSIFYYFYKNLQFVEQLMVWEHTRRKMPTSLSESDGLLCLYMNLTIV